MLNKKLVALSLVLVMVLMGAFTVGAWTNPKSVILTKIETPPTIDGVISGEEWGNPVIQFNGKEETDFGKVDDDTNWLFINYGETEKVKENISNSNISLYLRYDATNLYVGAVANIPGFKQTQKTIDMYKDYCMQIQIAPKGVSEGQALYEYGFAVKDGETMQYNWAPFGKSKDLNTKVVANGDIVTYEVVLPIADIGIEGNIADGNKYGITVGFTAGNGASPFAALQFGNALLTKKSENAMEIVASSEAATTYTNGTPIVEATPTVAPTVVATPEVEATPTAAPEVVVTPEVQAEDTANQAENTGIPVWAITAIIAAILAVVIALIIVMITSKKKNK